MFHFTLLFSFSTVNTHVHVCTGCAGGKARRQLRTVHIVDHQVLYIHVYVTTRFTTFDPFRSRSTISGPLQSQLPIAHCQLTGFEAAPWTTTGCEAGQPVSKWVDPLQSWLTGFKVGQVANRVVTYTCTYSQAFLMYMHMWPRSTKIDYFVENVH